MIQYNQANNLSDNKYRIGGGHRKVIMKLYTINATPFNDGDGHTTATIKCNDYPQEVANILNEYLVFGFTIYQVMGYWKSEAEPSFKIEIAMDDGQDGIDKIGSICATLRDKYRQDAVMLTYPDREVEFI